MTDDTLKAMEAFLAEEFRAVAERVQPSDGYSIDTDVGTDAHRTLMDLALRITEQYVQVHNALNHR